MMTIDSFWPIFFIAVAIQGVFLALALIIEKNSNQTNSLLSGLIILFSISLIDNVYYWVEIYQSFPHLLGVSLSFPFLYGPLFYLFVKRTKNVKQSHRRWIHFTPWLLVVVYLSPYYFSDAEAKLVLIETWHLNLIKGFIIPVAGLFSLIFYTYKSYWLIGSIEKQYDIQIIKGDHWLGKIYKAFVLFVSFNLIQFLLILTGLSAKSSDVIIALGLSIFIYFIGSLYIYAISWKPYPISINKFNS